MAVLWASDTLHRCTFYALWVGVNLAASFGPNATPGYSIDTLASKLIMSNTFLSVSMILWVRKRSSEYNQDWPKRSVSHATELLNPILFCKTKWIASPPQVSTSMCSPRRLPLLEKLEQLNISSLLLQWAKANALCVDPDKEDHTERQYSCPSERECQ